MKKAPFISFALVGILAAGSAAADPYASWRSASSDDDTISIADSFKRESSYESSYETNYSSDDDVTTTTQEDNDSYWSKSTDVDFQIATPTLNSYKHQDQDAGHQADSQAYSAASGHSVGVEGGTNLVKAGSSETVYYGPALVNTNKNFLPQNNLFIQGHNGGDIDQRNTVAGEDIGPKGVFAPIGNTSAHVMGNVGSQAGSSVDQSGDSANSIADPMSSTVQR